MKAKILFIAAPFMIVFSAGIRESDSDDSTPTPAPSPSPTNSLVEDRAALDAIRERFRGTQKSLKTHFPSQDALRQANADLERLAEIIRAHEADPKEAKTLREAAASLIVSLLEQRREIVAKSMEEVFLKQGIDAQIRAVGKNKRTLQVRSALMSRLLVYKLENESHIGDTARTVGFDEIVYSDGFGRSWTSKLADK